MMTDLLIILASILLGVFAKIVLRITRKVVRKVKRSLDGLFELIYCVFCIYLLIKLYNWL